jgi:hypothetical protein
MAINVACSSCGRQYTVKDDAAGKRFKCKDCEAVVEVPAAGGGGGGDAADDDYGDPYGEPDDAMADMPAPVTGRRRMSSPSVAAPAVTSKTKIPAICMYVVCGISIGYGVLSLASLAMGFHGPMPDMGDPQQQAQMLALSKTMGFGIWFIFILRDVFLIYAFSRMHMATAYGIAMAGAVISVIPCLGSPCCLLGVPFGIWALVILNDPAVKAGFR